MSALEFTTTVDMKLFREFFAAHEKRLQKRKPRKYTVLELFVLVSCYISFGVAISVYGDTFAWPAFIITSLFFIAVFIEYLYRMMRIADTIKLADNGLALGTHHYVFSEHGIEALGSDYKMHIRWPLVNELYETREAVIIQLDQLFAFVIRKSDVNNLNEVKQYVETRLRGNP